MISVGAEGSGHLQSFVVRPKRLGRVRSNCSGCSEGRDEALP